MIETDILILGSGIGALSVAGELCKNHRKVTVITKGLKKACNSSLAQGGISVALSEGDSAQLHYEDTMAAGCELNDPEAVMRLVSTAPEVIREFIDTGMVFDTDEKGNLLFGREAAHHLNRIIHAGGDKTGLRVVEQLIRNLTTDVTVIQNEPALELRVKDGKCCGVITRAHDGKINVYKANYTILATGGIGQLYPATSNDETITGDGLAMAYRAGARLKNLEFIQFHPTMLTIDGKAYGLVSEACRGAGGVLVNRAGKKIMEGVHPLKDLAPRDVVAREVYAHCSKGEEIFLDITAVENFRKKFPTVTEICEQHGVNIDDGLIPVAPGCHFHMGGVEATSDGLTSVEGLFAVGEVACTGVHGANRLASNSLLEGIVFGKLLADYILTHPYESVNFEDEPVTTQIKALPEKDEIKQKMMEFLGIVRHESKMSEIFKWFEQFMPDGRDFCKIDITKTTTEELERYNMLTAGYLIAKAAADRKESIGAHYIVK
ncbi:MAG TPA: L-aspartate oxidase [Lachnospiraceae bacterium]|nr:L-aspartate oxidase [Lachnospiraceae bacterium]